MPEELTCMQWEFWAMYGLTTQPLNIAYILALSVSRNFKDNSSIIC